MSRTSQTRTLRLVSGAVAIAAVSAVVLAPSAAAQNALGSGDVLDNRTIGGGNRALPLHNYDARNNLITGNIAGGRGFRGAVGYTAASDFRGDTGSDDIFEFRASSALSQAGLFTTGRSFDPLRFGQELALLSYDRPNAGATPGSLVLENPLRLNPRSNLGGTPVSGVSLSDLETTLSPTSQFPEDLIDQSLNRDFIDASVRLDLINQATSGAERYGSIDQAPVGIVQSQQGGRYLANASSLRGLSYSPSPITPQAVGLTSYDVARSLQDHLEGRPTAQVGRPFESPLLTGLPPVQPSPDDEFELRPGQVDPASRQDRLDIEPALGRIEDEPINTNVGGDYSSLVQSVMERYDNLAADATLGGWREDYNALRQQLSQPRLGDRSVESRLGIEQPDTDVNAPPGRLPALPGGDGSETTTPGIGTSPRLDPTLSPPGSPRGRGAAQPGASSSRLPSIPVPELGSLPGATGDSSNTRLPGAGLPEVTLPESSLPLPGATRAGTTGANPQLPQLPGSRVQLPGTQLPGAGVQPGAALPRVNEIDIREFAPILRHDQKIDQLAASTQSRFDEIMRSAEEALRSGEYFLAERRFARANRYTPGHPMALVGMAHAQLGAGLYLSSSVSLRSLLTHRPEMIDVRYDEALLPPRDRLEDAVATLRDRMESKDQQSRDRASAAFLAAYIGHQLGAEPIVRESLAVISDVAPEDPLLAVLEAVWLDRDANAGDAAEGDEAPDPELPPEPIPQK